MISLKISKLQRCLLNPLDYQRVTRENEVAENQ